MYLYLIQHGEAKSKEEDPERPLTDKGKKEIIKSATFLKKTKKPLDIIWHSGKKRALQTAEILSETLGGIPMKMCKGLQPNDDPEIIKKKFDTRSDESFAIVGHLPHLSNLATNLLNRHDHVIRSSSGYSTFHTEEEIVHFKNAGIICLSGNGRYWYLEWMITPDIIKWMKVK